LKRFISALIAIIAIFTLAGCLDRVEIKDLGVVSGLGIDKIDDGYLVTVQILNPTAISGGGGNPPLTTYSFTAEGRSIHEAYNKLDHVGSKAFTLSHLDVIVIDEKFAESGFAPILNFALRHAEVRPDITIVVAKDNTAKEVLNVVTALDSIPAIELDVSVMVKSRTARLVNFNLFEVVDIINSEGSQLILNSVSIYDASKEEKPMGLDNHGLAINTEETDDSVGTDEQNSESENQNQEETSTENDPNQGADNSEGATETADSTNEQSSSEQDSANSSSDGNKMDNIQDITDPIQLRMEHLAIFNDDRLVGFMDEFEAQIYNIFLGESKRYAFVHTFHGDEYYTSGRITATRPTIETDIPNNIIHINMDLDLMIIENTYPADLSKSEVIHALEEKFTETLTNDLQEFLDKTQNEWNADILGIGNKIFYSENKLWKEIEGYWTEMYPEMDFRLEVIITIDSVGHIGNVTI